MTVRIESVNPATEGVIATFEQFTPEQLEQALVEADTAFRDWRRHSIGDRSTAMRRAAELLRSRKERYAGLITAEMGKPITQAEAEVEKCAWVCDYFAEHAERFLARQPVQTNARVSYVEFEPLGIVLAVMPWNFPFWQVFRFAAPTLMAGNTAVLKHASNVPQCALAIEEVFRDAGFPRGALRTVLVPGSAVEAIIDDPRVRAVTLTGSNTTGEKVAAAAGRAIKKTVLELGGSDPFVVLDDADLGAAAAMAVRSRFQNGGQSCIAAKRFIVVASVAEEFERRFVEGIRKLKVGDPTDRSVDVGPLARADLRDTVDRQVRESVAQGARVVLGGGPRAGRGAGARAGHGRGDRARERHDLRARRQSVDARPRARAAARLTNRSRLRVHQRHGRFRPAPAVRRREAERLWARAVGVRDPRIREHPDGVDERRR